MRDLTIIDRLKRNAKERGDRPAAADPRSATFDAWDTLSWREYEARVTKLARAFGALGLEKGQCVSIAGPNCSAWAIADLAAIAAGGVPAGVYVTVTAEQARYIARHSRAPIYVAADHEQARKIVEGWAELPDLKWVVLFPGTPAMPGHDKVLTWEQALARGDAFSLEALEAVQAAAQPNDPATLIYTSGTTGMPKAVTLTHDNLTWTAKVAQELVAVEPGARAVSYLPLSHIAEQMLTLHVPITAGACVHFVAKMESLGTALPHVQPTYFLGVPRVWEKIAAKVESGVTTAPPARQKIFRAAQKIGLEVMRARFEGKKASLVAELAYPLFDKLVYSKLRARLGFEHTRVAATGAAPMSPATRDWLLSVGIPISEVYGQSEDSGPTTWNAFGRGKLGTVGRAPAGITVRIAEDGEILVKGRNVFAGYLNDPQATAEAIDADGWLHSGDVGVLDADGFLKITDRKKDLIITAGGKNVAPQNIERELRELPLVSQAVVIGDQKKYLVALLTVVPEATESLLAAQGVTEPDPVKRARHPAVRAALEKGITERVNPRLAQYETIKKFELLERELSEEGGELTPTMKIKRKVVMQKYGPQIEAMYAGGGEG
jgi:long-subunit acyl-CoA synthetase (AMP-forming)